MFVHTGKLYLVMEYCNMDTLEAFLKHQVQKQLDVSNSDNKEELIRVMTDSCQIYSF